MPKNTIEEVLAALHTAKDQVNVYLGFTYKGFLEGVEPLITGSDEVVTDLLNRLQTQTGAFDSISQKLKDSPEELKAFQELLKKAGVDSKAKAEAAGAEAVAAQI